MDKRSIGEVIYSGLHPLDWDTTERGYWDMEDGELTGFLSHYAGLGSNMIILLDLQQSLVSNADIKISPMADQIEHEEYRYDLIERLAGHFVILITSRTRVFEERTIDGIFRKTGWHPDQWYFNIGMAPQFWKSKCLQHYVFADFGRPPGVEYFGIEANPKVREEYAKLGIDSASYGDVRVAEILQEGLGIWPYS